MALALFAGSPTRQGDSFRIIADTINHLDATQVDVYFRIQPLDPSVPSRVWPNPALVAPYLAKMTPSHLNLKLVGQGVAEVCILCRCIHTVDPKRPKKKLMCMYGCMHVCMCV